MNEIDEEEGSAGPANVTGGIENFSPMLFGPISRIKPSDNKRKKKRKKKKMNKTKRTLREILEQSYSAERNEGRIKAAKSTLKITPEVPKRNPERKTNSEIKPKDNDGAKAVEKTKELYANRENQGRVPSDKKGLTLFQRELAGATSKLGVSPESKSKPPLPTRKPNN